ncbi:MAG: RyR domain-containing protein [Candidatus Berkelbacteria bacterium]|nr:RyR domain-containing protein [Candidatus Berkelbacteria bacterium]
MEYDMDYADLPDEIKADNIAAARRIPEVLSHAGLSVEMEDDIELLAEAEHDGWLNQKLNNRWSYGETRNDSKKIHNLLVPYNELSEKDKDKDKNSVRNYPGIVKMASYKIVRTD